MPDMNTTIPRRAHGGASGARGFILLAGAVMVVAAQAATELEVLGTRDFSCDQGDVYLQGSGSKKHYPAGKREEVALASDTGILRYTCKYVRSIVTCPLNTEMIRVKRGPFASKFVVTCMGALRARGAYSSGSPSAPEAAAPEE